MAKLLLGAGAMSVIVFGALLLVDVHGTSAVFAGGFVLIETVSWSMSSLTRHRLWRPFRSRSDHR